MTEQQIDAYPFVPAPDTVEVSCIYNVLGQQCVNVFHVHNGAHIDNLSAFATNVMNAFVDWETNDAKSLRSTACALVKVSVRDMGQENGQVFERVVSIAGTNAQQTLPTGVTFALKWNTGRGGRSYRGRTYVVGLTTTALANNQIQQTTADALVAAYTKLMNRINGTATGLIGFLFPTQDAYMAVVSKRQNGVWLTSGATVTKILSVTYSDLNLDSQRRRLAGRGR